VVVVVSVCSPVSSSDATAAKCEGCCFTNDNISTCYTCSWCYETIIVKLVVVLIAAANAVRPVQIAVCNIVLLYC
jgi:hypothetical protein